MTTTSRELAPGFTLDDRPKPHNYKGQDFKYAQHKRDGWRLTIVKETNHKISAFGRKDVNLWPKLVKHPMIGLLVREMPTRTILDGELDVPGSPAASVPTAMNAAWERMVFTPFGLPFYRGADWRPKKLLFVNQVLVSHEWIPPVTSISSVDWVEEDSQTIGEYYTKLATQVGIEGFVLKDSHYGDDWYKIKVDRTIDVVVSGLQDGNGKYVGELGAFEVSLYNESGTLVHIGRVGGGLSDELRGEVDEDDIGRVIEVKFDRWDANGGMRFPRFVRWRDDKPAQDCKLADHPDRDVAMQTSAGGDL